MILTLIFGVLTLAAIVFLILALKVNDDFLFFSVAAGGLGVIPFIIMLFMIISAQSPYTKEKARLNYSQTITQLNATIQYIDNISDDYARSIAVEQYNSDVKKFKQEIAYSKINLKNPWINWFESYVYNEFDIDIVSYIE